MNFLKNNISYLIALIVTLVWSLTTLYLIARALKIVVNTPVDLTGVLSIYATLTAAFMTVLNYYFSSSKGSESKQETINTLLNNQSAKNG